ncbi:MAG: restriction endonuclease subunit S [Candidatus Thiodiazotropha sp. (ex Myrtea sp. 'scaly one' KF741663)]|nr:restriction endonuclease subunit S [Candidatus Thiodiazotropha sp. (ex Myrtea sp. 'scaly one' KF741663)]
MDYKTYPEYAVPKIDSAEGIPAHWGQKKFRFLCTFGRGLGITKSDLVDKGVPCINYGEIHSKYGFEVVPEKQDLKCVPEDYLEKSPVSLLNNGDFVFADTSEDIEGAGNFSYLNSDTLTFAGYHTVIVRPSGEDSSRFLAYFIDSLVYRSQIRKSVSGVKVFSVTQSILKGSYIWLPPVEEQQKIAAFLDYKTQQIDQLIEKKKVLIEKLEEKRIAVITQVVTKGLDKNVKLKPSGVDWLGGIPSGWELKSLRFIGSCQNGINIGAEYFGQGDPFVSYGDVYNNKELPRSIDGLVQSSDGDKKSYSVEAGDVLFTRTSESIEEIGFSSVCMETIKDAVFAGFLIRFRPETNELTKEFSKYYFQNNLLRAFFVKEMNLVTRASLSQELLKKLPVLLPAIEEQLKIASFLEEETHRIDVMIKSIGAAIERLEEYRSAIITSAVTGKIDVREVEIPKEVA